MTQNLQPVAPLTTSLPEEVLLPTSIVSLTTLRLRDNRPVRVRCTAVPALTLGKLYEGLPGWSPMLSREELKALGEQMDQLPDRDKAQKLLIHAPELLVAGTSFDDPVNGDVRPAFAFDHLPQRHPRSLRGEMLAEGDQLDMLVEIFRLSGMFGPYFDELAKALEGVKGGNDAAGAGFSDGESAGRGHGEGDSAAGALGGQDGVAVRE